MRELAWDNGKTISGETGNWEWGGGSHAAIF
jgi:hypothetical protein